MPYIHIKSLPFKQAVDIGAAVETLSSDFSNDTGIAIEHITVTWDFLSPGCYAFSGNAANAMETNTHPLLVHIAAPDFHTPDQREVMMRSIANALSKVAEVSVANVFVHYTPIQSGNAFDGGQVLHW